MAPMRAHHQVITVLGSLHYLICAVDAAASPITYSGVSDDTLEICVMSTIFFSTTIALFFSYEFYRVLRKKDARMALLALILAIGVLLTISFSGLLLII